MPNFSVREFCPIKYSKMFSSFQSLAEELVN